jgi:hypothetical protein
LKKEDFRKLKLAQRYELIKEHGTYLAARNHAGFQCFLYQFHNYYVEVWKPMGLNIIQWIEVVNRDEIIDSYLDHFKLDL